MLVNVTSDGSTSEEEMSTVVTLATVLRALSGKVTKSVSKKTEAPLLSKLAVVLMSHALPRLPVHIRSSPEKNTAEMFSP